jgi:hypothetical protein
MISEANRSQCKISMLESFNYTLITTEEGLAAANCPKGL